MLIRNIYEKRQPQLFILDISVGYCINGKLRALLSSQRSVPIDVKILVSNIRPVPGPSNFQTRLVGFANLRVIHNTLRIKFKDFRNSLDSFKLTLHPKDYPSTPSLEYAFHFYLLPNQYLLSICQMAGNGSEETYTVFRGQIGQ